MVARAVAVAVAVASASAEAASSAVASWLGLPSTSSQGRSTDVLAGGESSITEFSSSAKPLYKYQETHSELTVITYLALH